MARAKRKTRLDCLLVERGLAESREKAQALILSGYVFVGGQRADKCGTSVDEHSQVYIATARPPYVSRGGLKLEAALDHFGLNPAGRICLDIGSSTGGFTDCLLRRGAARVYAVDSGRHQLDQRLRQDPRVVVMEKTNARYLTLERLGARCSLVTVDVSFISATLILPVLPPLLEPPADILVLVKPQFEVGRGQVGKGGIVRDPDLRQQAVAKVRSAMVRLGFEEIDWVESALPGAEGNREYFLHAFWRQAI